MKISILKYFILTSLLISNFFGKKLQSQSLRFTDSSFVNLGNNSALKLTDFTIEAWVKIENYASTTETGSGGVSGFVPIVSKGRAESETPAVDVNYIVGYRMSDRKIVADFEDNINSANHPVVSNTALPLCTWAHIAVSYSVSTFTWKVYINGTLDATLVLSSAFVPQSLSNINACIGSTLNTGTTIRPGFFNGRIDEVRIWNTARTDAEISTNYYAELTSGTGLVARYGLNENNGALAINSIAATGNGSFSPALPRWVKGYNQTEIISEASMDFNGAHDYVTFGKADGTAGFPSLNASSFTLEAWIKIIGTGIATTSGTGGHATIIPIVAKGRGEAETPINLNMNYIFGISTTNFLLADYEDVNNGLNHPVTATTNAIPTNVWTHVATSFETATRTWKLYVNGVLIKTQVESATGFFGPVTTSIQHASLASALTSTGAPAGFFNGKIDEVRIWNTVRTDAEVQTNYQNTITSATGLLGRYGFNENCGTTIANSVSGGAIGRDTSNNVVTHPTNGGPSWHSFGYNANSPIITASNPTNGQTAVSTPTAIITATINEADNQASEVCFYGRAKSTPCTGGSSGTTVTIIGIPDTQFYTSQINGGSNNTFKAQTQWIADNRVAKNIIFASQLGDCAQNGDNIAATDPSIEYRRADTAMKTIENPNVPITDGIPFNISVGNHDQGPTGNGDPLGTTNLYNQYFGNSRFIARNYYGGFYGSNYDNHYELFSGGGIDWIDISFEYDPTANAAVLTWADNLLKAYPNRKGIISSHWIINSDGSFSAQGLAIYNALKGNNNLVLMLCGHVNPNGEARRSDVFNNHTIHTLLSDYQDRTNGGNGWLRIMELNSTTGVMNVTTYSPTLNQFETDANSQFIVTLDLAEPFSPIGCVSNVPANSLATINYTGLLPATSYEYYTTANDGENSTTSITNCFTTSATALPIQRLQLRGTNTENNMGKLIWDMTADEKPRFFEIEVKTIGNDFKKIATFSEISINQKSFNTLVELTNCEANYYRVKAVLNNGSYYFSNQINLKKQCIDVIKVFPVPAKKQITIQTGSQFNYTIYNATGKLMQRGNAVNNKIIAINAWLSGFYFIAIFMDGYTTTKKILVTH